MYNNVDIKNLLERVNSITGIQLSLLDDMGNLIGSWPPSSEDLIVTTSSAAAIKTFRMKGCDTHHPMIAFIDPGLLLGILELESGDYVMIGLVSPYVHSRADILMAVSEAIHPIHLQGFCDRLLNQPIVSLEKLKDLICVITRLLDNEVASESICFVDTVTNKKIGASELGKSMFEQREESQYHVPIDFETAICSAVEAGDRVMLERSIFTPLQGKIGRMSTNDLRQQKYAFVCLATLVSRAAIRGGLPDETAFSLSDLYCQRADLLMEIPLLQNLTFTMLMDFCGKVREITKTPTVSPIIEKCLRFISVHLHETISLEQLSQYCGLCSRSLSLKFREELNVGIPEYIHREKLKEAEYLLRHTDYSLSEIASYLNYPSQSYFTQIFKKYKEQTPQQFREARIKE